MAFSCSEKSLDDLLREVFSAIRAEGRDNKASRGGTQELIGAHLELVDPRARLSVTESRGRVISALGELLWYLSGSNALESIAYYIGRYRAEEENGVIYGGYGPRLFAHRGQNQVENVLALLQASGPTRRAVIQLFDAEDIAAKHREIPCTCTLQFLAREGRLHMVVSMRSNDAYLGLPHDVFCFTMMQEIFARRLGLELGSYVHFAGSLHLYEDDMADVDAYMREGWQSEAPMPPMPLGDPRPALTRLIELERIIRERGDVDPSAVMELDPYWADLVRLLLVLSYSRADRQSDLRRIHQEIGDIFKPLVQARLGVSPKRTE